MDSGTIITTIILLAGCILPFVFMNIKRKNKEKMLLQSLHQMAGNNHAVISQYDIWGNVAVGIDEKTKQAFFFKLVKEQESFQRIDLAEIKHCRVLKTGKNAELKDSTHKVFETIELAFASEESYSSDVAFEFYNATHDGFALKGELQAAEKWCRLFNENAGMAV